jgi:hypothetical protein
MLRHESQSRPCATTKHNATVSQEFVPGRKLNAGFYREVVEPLVQGYGHAAALLGWGSDVLGYDTARSTDHGWGPRLQLFVDRKEIDDVRRVVGEGLPETYSGRPVRFGWDDKPVRHWVDVTTLTEWLKRQLGLDPRDGMSTVDWLSVPQQHILGVVSGAVYADPRGELRQVREALSWYPHDVWLWLLASQWQRIGQEEAFTGRAAEVGDELGSRLIASRQVHELMRLAFLQARTYWPYSKWFGTAFSQLPGASELTPALHAAVAATDFPSREAALVGAYEIIARRHNGAGITAKLEPTVRGFYDRPFRVLFAERFAVACQEAINDGWLRELPRVGAVNQFVDSTDVLSVPARPQQLRGLFTGGNEESGR